jgi:hypothetical protein
MKFEKKAWVFLLTLVFSVTLYLDFDRNDNSASRVFTVLSITEKHTTQIDDFQEKLGDKSFVNNHYYSDKAPLPAFVVAPIFYLTSKVIHLSEENAFAFVGFIGSTVPFFGMMLLFYFSVKKEVRKSYIYLIPLLFLSSFLFIYSSTFFGHIMSAFLLLTAFRFFEKTSFFLMGLFMGFAFASEFPLAIIGFVWGLQILYKHSFRSFMLFSLGVLPSIIFIASYNYLLTGSPFQMLYKFVVGYDFMHQQYGMHFPTFTSLYGLTFSSYRGWFIYLPLLFILGYNRVINFKKIILHPIFMPVIIFVPFMASYEMWWGGWSWGPRHFIAISVLVMLDIFRKIISGKVNWLFVWTFIGIGFIINIPAKVSVTYSLPTEVKNPFAYVWKDQLFKGNFNHNSWIEIIYPSNGFLPMILLSGSVLILYYFAIRYTPKNIKLYTPLN